jgi:hypothetical protein
MDMQKIAIEEHFLTKDFVTYAHSRTVEPIKKVIDDPTTKRCLDLERNGQSGYQHAGALHECAQC